MKRSLAILMGIMLLLSVWSSAFAASVDKPAVKCDGSSVDHKELVTYDLADGTLTIKWTPQSAADHYYYKCIGLNEAVDFEDSYQGNRGTTLAEGEVTSNTTSKCKFTLSTSKMEDYSNLKIAIAAYDSDGASYWTNFGVELYDSDKIVKEPDLYCDGSSVDSQEIVGYDLADGTLTIKWTPQSAADSYYYKCIGLNEKPDFWDSYQGNRGTTLAEGTVTSNTTTRCKFTVSPSEMEDFAYLKVAVAAYDEDGTAYWKNFGVQLSDSSATELVLSDSSVDINYAGGSDSVTVSGVSGYSISYPTEDETEEGKMWLVVSKSGNSININARANYSASSRSEKITVTSSDGQTKTITVTQNAGYAAPTASIRVGNTAYNSGDTYGPLANGGEDSLWLYVDVQNARRIHVATGTADIEARDLNIAASASKASYECAFKIPEGLAAGTYTFTVYVSNSDVKNDVWSQAITPITLNVKVVNASGTQSYRPSSAISYAIKYALNYNSAYSNYNSIGGDCANFVSQCLIAGGFQMDTNWYWYSYDEHSGSWTGANSLRSYLSGTLGYKCIASPAMSDLHAGDIIWSNGGGHVMIVTEVGAGYFKYCGHNKDQQSQNSTGTSWLTHVVQMPGTGGAASEPTTAPESVDPYPPSGSTLLAVAQSQLGYTGSSTSENITGVNVSSVGDYTKYGVYTGAEGQDWCASFVAWCGNQAGVSNIKKSAGASPAHLCSNAYTKGGVVYFNTLNDTQKANHPYLETYGIKGDRSSVVPSAGDLIFFRWSTAGSGITFSHVGIVSKVVGGTVYYIDGNGSGDVVKERSKSLTSTDIAAYCKVTGTFSGSVPTPAPIVASDPAFNGYSALSVQDYDLANGSLTISWSANNASRYFVTAILLNEMPTKDDDSQSERAVKTIKKEEQTANSLTMTVDDLTGGQYLKFAVGAAAEGESTYHWSWVGFHLVEVPATCEHASCTWKTVQGATCSAEGLEEYTCNNCGAVLNSRTIARKAHTAGAWEIITNATETSTGLKRQSCTVCGATMGEESIPMVTPSNPEEPDMSDISMSASANVTGVAGGTVTVPVSIINPNGVLVSHITLELSLPVGVTMNKDEVTGCGMASGAKTVTNVATIVMSIDSVALNGHILNIPFKLSSDVQLPVNITISPQVISFNEELMNCREVTVAISEPTNRIPGDVTSDGVVDGRDSVRLLKHLAHLDVTINAANSDVTGDGIIDGRDSVRLLKHLAHLDVVLK